MELEEYNRINNKLQEIQFNCELMNIKLNNIRMNFLAAHIIIFLLISIATYIYFN